MFEKTLEGLLDCKGAKPVNPKGNQSLIFIGRTDAEAKTLILRPPVWSTDSFEKPLMLGNIEDRRGNDRKWDGWMASLTRWTWDWASSMSWWWTAKPGMLGSMGSQRAGHDWVSEPTELTSDRGAPRQHQVEVKRFDCYPLTISESSQAVYRILGWPKSLSRYSVKTYGNTQMDLLTNPRSSYFYQSFSQPADIIWLKW